MSENDQEISNLRLRITKSNYFLLLHFTIASIVATTLTLLFIKGTHIFSGDGYVRGPFDNVAINIAFTVTIMSIFLFFFSVLMYAWLSNTFQLRRKLIIAIDNLNKKSSDNKEIDIPISKTENNEKSILENDGPKPPPEYEYRHVPQNIGNESDYSQLYPSTN